MKKSYHILPWFILLGFVFSSFIHSPGPQKLIIGKWELKEIVSADSIPNPIEAAINKYFVGITYEYKKDSIVKAELSKKQSLTGTFESSPCRYYLVKEKKKYFLIHLWKGNEERYKISILDAETLCYTGNGETYILKRLKQ